MDFLFFASFLITGFFLLTLCPLSVRIGLTDQPCARKQHSGEVPLIGGLSIYLCVVSLYYWSSFSNHAFILAATLIVVCGVIDDFKPISVKSRLLVEIIAAAIMIHWGGVEITTIGNLFGFGEIELGIFSPLFTVFAVVGGINAFNMLDGIDGLVGSLSLVALTFLLIVTINTPQIASLCLIFIPAISAFLLFNMRILGRKKASVFLGDTGSMLFGFTFCWILISISQGENRIISPVTTIWILAVPIMDTVTIMFRRVVKGQSPFAADRGHFHHILQAMGCTVNQTVGFILAISCVLTGFGLLGEKVIGLPEWVLFNLFIILTVLHFFAMSHAWKVMKILKKTFGQGRVNREEQHTVNRM